MTKQGFTYIGLVLDRSGSMANIQRDMEGALNTFLVEQKKIPGECEVSLYTFDNDYEVAWEHRAIQTVPEVHIHPRGTTALLDAIGKTIHKMGIHFASLAEDQRPEKVLVVVTTDGFENASREFTADKIKEMISHQEDTYGWAFTFLGANQDAFLVGDALGFNPIRTSNFGANQVGTQAVSANLIAATTRMRGAVGQSASSSYGYTKDEQDAGDKSTT